MIARKKWIFNDLIYFLFMHRSLKFATGSETSVSVTRKTLAKRKKKRICMLQRKQPVHRLSQCIHRHPVLQHQSCHQDKIQWVMDSITTNKDMTWITWATATTAHKSDTGETLQTQPIEQFLVLFIQMAFTVLRVNHQVQIKVKRSS